MEIFPYKISTVTPRPCTLAGPTSEHDRDLFHVERIRTQLLHRSVVLECVDSTMRDFGPPQPSVRQERRGRHKLEVDKHRPCWIGDIPRTHRHYDSGILPCLESSDGHILADGSI